MPITDEQIREAGYEIFTNRGDHFIAVAPMTYGKGRIIISDSLDHIDNAWCYKSMHSAIKALADWETTKAHEPEGWFRNPIDGRRRENGDPSKETLRW